MISCPNCHQPVQPTNYFCPNCGKKLKNPPLSTSFSSQIFLYLKTLIFPPFGFIWGYRYLRQSDSKSKIIGLIVIMVTLVETIWLIQFTINFTNTLNQQINQSLQDYGL